MKFGCVLLALWFLAWPVMGADYAQAGAFTRNDRLEITVSADSSVKPSSLLLRENYLLPAPAVIEEVRAGARDNSTVLSVSGLMTNAAFDLVLTNFQSSANATLPPLRLSLNTQSISWAAIGTQEFGLPAEAISLGNGAFDLISGASEMYGTYDESTFVYEQITGDFDRRVRLVSQEASSPEARAGLMVRETLDEGKVRPLDPSNPSEAFSRYLQIQVNPVNTAFMDLDGQVVPANNQYQITFRALPGGPTENPPADTNAPPYPNAWLRLKRVGQTFHVFRGNDGTNWVRLGTFTFPTVDLDGNAVAPFSKTAFAGPNYSPEVANIPESSGARRAFLAQFRDYSNASGDVELEQPELTISRSANGVEVAWTAGILQTTTNIVSGPWTDQSGASPLKLQLDKRQQYYRARNP